MKNFIERVWKTRASKAVIIEAAKSIDKCQFGTSIIALSCAIRMEKQKTNEALFKSLFGFEFSEVAKVSFIRNFRRYDYAAKVENLSGNTGFNVAKQSGASQSDIANCIKVTDKDGSLMLQCSYTIPNGTKVQTAYIINGKRLATPQEAAFISDHLYTYKGSTKQHNFGVAEGEEVRFMQFKFDNIISIGRNQLVEPIWDQIKGTK